MLLNNFRYYIYRVYGESFEVITDMVVDRHLKSCKLMASVVLTDTSYPFRLYIPPRLSPGRTRRQCIRIHAQKQKYKSSTIHYLGNIPCDEQVVRADLVNTSCS